MHNCFFFLFGIEFEWKIGVKNKRKKKEEGGIPVFVGTIWSFSKISLCSLLFHQCPVLSSPFLNHNHKTLKTCSHFLFSTYSLSLFTLLFYQLFLPNHIFIKFNPQYGGCEWLYKLIYICFIALWVDLSITLFLLLCGVVSNKFYYFIWSTWVRPNINYYL